MVASDGPVLVEVFSDIACPWCYIGEKRLSRAMEELQEVPVQWRWKPYQLQPGLPERGVEWKTFADAKFGGEAGAAMAFRNVSLAAADVGIEFRFDRVTRAPNTAAAHRAVLYAQEHDRGRPMAEALFRAYFTDGRDVTDPETIVALGEQVGLDASALGDHLASPDAARAVRDSQEEAIRLGIAGVPFYIFDRKLGLSGAQPAEIFVRALQRAAALTTG